MRFVHLTDLHVSHPDVGDQTLDTDTVATLERAIARIESLDPVPDFVVASGDLANRGHDESYTLVKQMMSGLSMPVVYALGNHDRRAGFRAAFPNFAGASDSPLDHDVLQGELHVITLDTSEPGRVAGTLEARQLAFLEQALARHPERRKLLVLHHAPMLDTSAAPDWTSLDAQTTRTLASHLEGRDVVAILSGHIHYDRVAVWHGIPVVVANGLHASVDLLAREALHIVEGTSMGLCDLTESGLSVSFLRLEDRPVLRAISRERLRQIA